MENFSYLPYISSSLLHGSLLPGYPIISFSYPLFDIGSSIEAIELANAMESMWREIFATTSQLFRSGERLIPNRYALFLTGEVLLATTTLYLSWKLSKEWANKAKKAPSKEIQKDTKDILGIKSSKADIVSNDYFQSQLQYVFHRLAEANSRLFAAEGERDLLQAELTSHRQQVTSLQQNLTEENEKRLQVEMKMLEMLGGHLTDPKSASKETKNKKIKDNPDHKKESDICKEENPKSPYSFITSIIQTPIVGTWKQSDTKVETPVAQNSQPKPADEEISQNRSWIHEKINVWARKENTVDSKNCRKVQSTDVDVGTPNSSWWFQSREKTKTDDPPKSPPKHLNINKSEGNSSKNTEQQTNYVSTVMKYLKPGTYINKFGELIQSYQESEVEVAHNSDQINLTRGIHQIASPIQQFFSAPTSPNVNQNRLRVYEFNQEKDFPMCTDQRKYQIKNSGSLTVLSAYDKAPICRKSSSCVFAPAVLEDTKNGISENVSSTSVSAAEYSLIYQLNKDGTDVDLGLVSQATNNYGFVTKNVGYSHSQDCKESPLSDVAEKISVANNDPISDTVGRENCIEKECIQGDYERGEKPKTRDNSNVYEDTWKDIAPMI